MPKAKNNAQKGTKYKIKVSRNGPYLVSGGVPLSEQVICTDVDGECHGWKEGKIYPVQENYALCRCGRSKNGPYCDGTHARIRFDGAETAGHEKYLEQASEIRGPDLKLTDAQDLCVGAGFCHRAGGAWKLTEGSANPEARQKAIEEACDCPSGRLVAWDNEGKAIEPEYAPPSIGLVRLPGTEDKHMGPIWVRGGIPVESADGEIYEIRNRVTLCRCGKSSNKPFCDGSHPK